MAKATCPEGHPTEETDYCDVCGAPIDASAVTSGVGEDAPEEDGQGGAPVGLRCPNCQVMNAPDALFCEACGYDYTTGTLPRAAQPSVLELDMEAARADQQAGPADARASAEANGRTGATAVDNPLDLDAPAAAATTDSRGERSEVKGSEDGEVAAARAEAPSAVASNSEAPNSEVSNSGAQSAEATSAEPRSAEARSAEAKGAEAGDSQAKDSADVPAGTSAVGGATSSGGAAGGTDRVIASTEPIEFDWVAEVWIDPDWYRLQESPDQLPSPGLPEMYPLKSDRILIGRPSRSRNISPDIDCEPDSGTSRRQAELTTDGRNWFVEDLDSANGTFVGQAAGALPETPIPSGKKHQLDADDRIYVGAWTRLVLRKATEDEKEAFLL